MQPTLETIPPQDDASFVCRRFGDATFDYGWHFHPEIELTLIVSGQGLRYVGNSIEAFELGDLVLLGANLPHSWHSAEADRGRCEAVVVQFDPSTWGSGLLGSPEGSAVADLLRRAERGLAFAASSPNHGVKPPRQRMLELVAQRGWARLTGLLELLGSLAETDEASRTLSAPAHALPPRADDQRRIDRVCRLLAERYAGPLTQAEAAASVHLSPGAFSRFFKRTTGRTFVAHLHELRIADACRRLGQTDAPVTDICFACGFENVSNFNRVFRRLRGVSPRTYRRSLG
ncbi:MAG: AraC family transcriptional regulator [Planctomycetota bacterium]